jgi:hypothetical protein
MAAALQNLLDLFFLSGRSPAASLGIGYGFCLALYFFPHPLLLGFRGLAFCLSIGGHFCLALHLFFEPLLLSFRCLQFCLNIGCFCPTLFLFFEGG